MGNLTDLAGLPVIELWGAAVRARRVDGERLTLAVVELAPNAVVPGHDHDNEQLGLLIAGRVTFTIGDEVREFGPGGTWRIPSGVHHQVTVGPAGAVAIDVFAPVRGDWDDQPVGPPEPPVWPAGD